MIPTILPTSRTATATPPTAAGAAARGSADRLPDCEPRQLGSDLFHALSQPLTALSCALELSLTQNLTGEQYRESASRALVEAERVSRLAMGIRELFEAGQAGEDCEVQALQVAVAAAIDDVRLVAEEAGVRIWPAPESACPVWFDARRLRSALFHLLGFVVGWGNGGSLVRIEVAQSEGEALLSLSVSGQGQARAGSSDSGDEDRSGELARRLGLGIARVSFEAAGGSWRAECNLEGIRVEIRLPQGESSDPGKIFPFPHSS